MGKVRRQEGLDDLPGLLVGPHPASQGDDVGVIVKTGQLGNLDGVGQRSTNSLDLVSRDLLAVYRAAQNDAQGTRLSHHGLSARNAVVRVVVEGIVGRRAVVDDLISGLGQLANEELLELEGRVISTNMNV